MVLPAVLLLMSKGMPGLGVAGVWVLKMYNDVKIEILGERTSDDN